MEKIKELANKRKLSATDKEYIMQVAEAMGSPIKNKRCGDCYKDKIIELLSMGEVEPKSESRYTLKRGVDVVWNGMRINKYTINDELCEALINAGFPKGYFVEK